MQQPTLNVRLQLPLDSCSIATPLLLRQNRNTFLSIPTPLWNGRQARTVSVVTIIIAAVTLGSHLLCPIREATVLALLGARDPRPFKAVVAPECLRVLRLRLRLPPLQWALDGLSVQRYDCLRGAPPLLGDLCPMEPLP